MAETKKIHDAIIFAAKAHEGQRRKGTDIPYITHPFEVAQILMEAGCDETLIIAGLLHDTLEDTEVTAAEIEEQFGPEVLALVDSDSEDKSLSWEDRKKHTIEYLRDRASLEELLLACADKLANMRSIKADYMVLGDKVWDRFHRGKEQQSWYYSSLIDVFDGLSDYTGRSQTSIQMFSSAIIWAENWAIGSTRAAGSRPIATQRRSADGRRSAPGHGRSLNQNSRSFPRKRRSPWRMPGVISIHP